MAYLVTLSGFKDKWIKQSERLMNVFRALVSDHLFASDKQMHDYKKIKNSHKLNLETTTTTQQYLASLTYFYGLEQSLIDKVETMGLLGFRKKNLTRKILDRYRKKINQRAKYFEKAENRNEKLMEIDKYINGIWN